MGDNTAEGVRKTIIYTLPGNPSTSSGRVPLPNEHIYTVQDAKGNRLFDVKRSSRPADFVVVLKDTAGKSVLRLRRTHFCTQCISYGVYGGTKNYGDANLLFMMEKKMKTNSIKISFPSLATAWERTAPAGNLRRPTYHIRTLGLGLEIIRNRYLVTKVSRAINLSMFKGRKKYTMSVQPGEDRALLSSMVVIFDMMKLPGYSYGMNEGDGDGDGPDAIDVPDGDGHGPKAADVPKTADGPDGPDGDSDGDSRASDNDHNCNNSHDPHHTHDLNHGSNDNNYHHHEHSQNQQNPDPSPHYTCDAIHDATHEQHHSINSSSALGGTSSWFGDTSSWFGGTSSWFGGTSSDTSSGAGGTSSWFGDTSSWFSGMSSGFGDGGTSSGFGGTSSWFSGMSSGFGDGGTSSGFGGTSSGFGDGGISSGFGDGGTSSGFGRTSSSMSGF